MTVYRQRIWMRHKARMLHSLRTYGGLGEGHGAKDVSDQIESQDQLEDAHKAGEEKDKENQDHQPDIKAEDSAIEMDDDMDGKLQDLQLQGKEEDGLLRRKMKTSHQTSVGKSSHIPFN